MAKKRLLLGEYLINEGLITPDQLNEALAEQKKTGELLGKVLLRLNFISEETMAHFLSCFFEIDYIDISTMEIKEEVVELVPQHLAMQHSVVPVAMDDQNKLIIAMKDPQDAFAIDELRKQTGCDVEPKITTASQIDAAIEKYYQQSRIQEIISSHESASEKAEAAAPEAASEEDLTEDAPVIKLIDQLLVDAVKEGASDIHIEPEEKNVSVRFRLDGILKDVAAPPKPMHEALISRIKVMSNLDIAEKRIPQDGRFNRKIENINIDLRVSICPMMLGEKAVMRILKQDSVSYGLEYLGFSPKKLKLFNNLIKRPHGIMLVTGPTGSGKTTTLYSALESIKSREKNMMTIEDPVEYRLPGVYQAQVNTKAGLNFATLLRSLMRQDPDIIMVGEIRDKETAQIAVRAALTGHLVFSTLHTNSAPATVTRLVDMGVEPFLIATSTIGIMAQRLMRVICPDCKTKATLSKEQAESLEIPQDSVLYEGKGCETCRDTGYKGREGIHELMAIDAKIKDLIVASGSVAAIKKCAQENGMKTLREEAIAKALKGATTIEEVFRVTEAD